MQLYSFVIEFIWLDCYTRAIIYYISVASDKSSATTFTYMASLCRYDRTYLLVRYCDF